MSSTQLSKPIDVATRETVAFLASHLGPSALVLEVGCGAGHVAAELSRLGHRVSGIDSDSKVVAAAAARGLPVVEASWPDYEGGPFDALVFTRSLHHIGDLDPAVARAREVLEPGGSLLVEDFAFHEAERRGLRWFVEVLRSRTARSLITDREGEVASVLVESGDPLAAWQDRHERYEINTAAQMLAAIEKLFVVKESRQVPYFYRYLIPVLPETPAAAGFTEDVRREEADLAGSGDLVPIGRRIVGSKERAARHARRA